MEFSLEELNERHEQCKPFLHSLGFFEVGLMKFYKEGKTYDLSAADLTQIDRIEREGLFIVYA